MTSVPIVLILKIVTFFSLFSTLKAQFIRNDHFYGPWDNLEPVYWSTNNEAQLAKFPFISEFLDEIKKVTCLNITKTDNNRGYYLILFAFNNGPFELCPRGTGRYRATQSILEMKNDITYKEALHTFIHYLALGDSNLRRKAGDYIERTNNLPAYQLGPLHIENFTETNVPYDVGGIMHLPCDETTQCRPKDKNKLFSVSNNMLTFSDIRFMNYAYACHRKCSIDAYERCYFPNKGLPDSRNCETCICPDGFEGPECTDRRKELGANGPCGDTLTATYQDQILDINLPKPSQEGKPNACIYHIQAPPGKQVVAKVLEFNLQGPSATMTENFDLTGPRFCCKYAYEQKKIGELTSKDGLIVIKANSYHEDTNAKISYKVV